MTDSPPITLRRRDPSDYAALQRMFSDASVYGGTTQLPYPSLEYWRKRAEEYPDNYSLVALVGDELVGEIGLHTSPDRPRRRHAGQIGIAVRADWQGKGVGSALMAAIVDVADNWMNLHRLELEVFTDNAPAIRLYEKFGFKIEGTLVDYGFRNGRYVDVYTMARIRSVGATDV